MKVSYGKKVSVSFKKSAKQTSIKHNNRELDYEEKQNKWHKHIDHDQSHLNKTLIKKDIKEMYEEIFGEAVQEYNTKQKRSDRKIKNYYSKILQNKKLEPQREFILQIGDKKDFETGKIRKLSEISNKLLEKYVEDFEDRNPNLKIYNAVIHNDEASPHLHLNVIPVASGYKRGVQLQPSFDKALKQQGVEFDTQDSRSLMTNFREKEVGYLEKLLEKERISRKEVGTNSIKDHHEYKEMKRAVESLEQEVEDLSDSVEELSEEVKLLEDKKEFLAEELQSHHLETIKEYYTEKVPKDKYVIISRNDFNYLEEQNELVPKMVKQNTDFKAVNDWLTQENEEQREEIKDLEYVIGVARSHFDRLIENGESLWNRAMTYAAKFYAPGAKHLPEDMIDDPQGSHDYDQWAYRNGYNDYER